MQTLDWLNLMKENNSVTRFDVLMSTFNGERYISHQLDSLLVQKEYINKIYIRDDGSTDRTLDIIREYMAVQTQLISLVKDDKGNLGPGKSFFSLCDYASSSFVAFCDQDDVWNSSKLSIFSEFISENRINGEIHPALIHSDLNVVDDELSQIYPSFWDLMNIKSDDNLLDILIRNTVTGCACVVSHELIKKYRGVSTKFKLHDHFFAACAALEKAIYRIDSPLVNYRQHDSNCVGINRRRKSFLQKICTMSLNKIINVHFSYDWISLSRRIKELQELSIDPTQALQLEKLLDICDSYPVKRIFLIIKIKLMSSDMSENNFKYLLFRPFNFNKG